MKNVRRLSPNSFVMFVQLALASVVAMLVGYLFRETIHDYMQHDSDAAFFYEAASTGDYYFAIDDTILANENALPVITWGWFYEAAHALGLPVDPAWGILLNAVLVIGAQLIAVLYARRKFGFDDRKSMWLTLLMSLNGVIMMFAGIHMRDAFLLLMTVISVIAFHPPDGAIKFVSYLKKIPLLLLLMVLSFLCRVEAFIVPLLTFCIAATFSLRNSRFSTKLALVIFAAIAIGGVLSLDVVRLVVANYELYQMQSADESGGGSLAYTLIYELPFPISTIAGSTLILFVKFPFWKSMFYDSYTFYVSIAAIQMMFIAPAFIALVAYFALNGAERSYAYLLWVALAMLFITAITSNQVRHFAVVYPFVFLLYCSRAQIIDANRVGLYRLIQYSIFLVAVSLTAFVGLRG